MDMITKNSKLNLDRKTASFVPSNNLYLEKLCEILIMKALKYRWVSSTKKFRKFVDNKQLEIRIKFESF